MIQARLDTTDHHPQNPIEVDFLLERSLTLIAPLILLTNLLLLLRGEVILDVEGNTNLLGRLSLEHISNSFTSQIKQVLNFQEVRGLQEKERC